MNVNVYQHFRKEEHPFVDIVSDWIAQVEGQYAPYLTDFLDPRQAYMLEMLVKSTSNLQFSFYGGYEQAERKRALIYPDYYEPELDDYDIVMYEINYPTKFCELSHGKILGTLLSTGIRREFFGDIISDGFRWQFFVKKDMTNFIETQFDKIGKVPIKINKCSYTDIIIPKDTWEVEHLTVTSMRIDVVIASVFNISRQRAKLLIESNKVKVNWSETERVDTVLALLDIISIRGFGRIQLREIEGKSKKDKFKLELGILRK